MTASQNKMQRYGKYVADVEQLILGNDSVSRAQWRTKVEHCLNGEPWDVLRQEVEIHLLKENGAFFTSTKLANCVVNKLDLYEHNYQSYFDPTCGAGDLLLAVAKQLPTASTFNDTLLTWNEMLFGCDIVPEFVRLTKARLVLLAAKRCRTRLDDKNVRLRDTFTNIVSVDFLTNLHMATKPDVVVMNPPFGYRIAPKTCKWAQGRINAAALFIENTINQTKNGARTVAILPDVLRSGSRYQSWRNEISIFGSINSERSLGVFDKWADVDVYLFDFCRSGANDSRKQRIPPFVKGKKGGIGKRFEIHVGTVVPHRHPEVGKDVPYVHARSLPSWSECERIEEKRKFDGRLFKPPFVVVRRTSRPGSGKRATATIVNGKEAVAVENHLIVFLPKDGKLNSCRALMRRLYSTKTDEWLNRRLRCRHLTIPAFNEMPWWYQL